MEEESAKRLDLQLNRINGSRRNSSVTPYKSNSNPNVFVVQPQMPSTVSVGSLQNLANQEYSHPMLNSSGSNSSSINIASNNNNTQFNTNNTSNSTNSYNNTTQYVNPNMTPFTNTQTTNDESPQLQSHTIFQTPTHPPNFLFPHISASQIQTNPFTFGSANINHRLHPQQIKKSFKHLFEREIPDGFNNLFTQFPKKIMNTLVPDGMPTFAKKIPKKKLQGMSAQQFEQYQQKQKLQQQQQQQQKQSTRNSRSSTFSTTANASSAIASPVMEEPIGKLYVCILELKDFRSDLPHIGSSSTTVTNPNTPTAATTAINFANTTSAAATLSINNASLSGINTNNNSNNNSSSSMSSPSSSSTSSLLHFQCILLFEGQRRETKMSTDQGSQSNSIAWSQNYSFQVTDENSHLYVEIYYCSSSSPQQLHFFGYVNIPLSYLQPNQTTDDWFGVFSELGEPLVAKAHLTAQFSLINNNNTASKQHQQRMSTMLSQDSASSSSNPLLFDKIMDPNILENQNRRLLDELNVEPYLVKRTNKFSSITSSLSENTTSSGDASLTSTLNEEQQQHQQQQFIDSVTDSTSNSTVVDKKKLKKWIEKQVGVVSTQLQTQVNQLEANVQYNMEELELFKRKTKEAYLGKIRELEMKTDSLELQILQMNSIVKLLSQENKALKVQVTEHDEDLSITSNKLATIEEAIDDIRGRQSRKFKEWLYLLLAYVVGFFSLLIVVVSFVLSKFKILKPSNDIDEFKKILEEQRVNFERLAQNKYTPLSAKSVDSNNNSTGSVNNNSSSSTASTPKVIEEEGTGSKWKKRPFSGSQDSTNYTDSLSKIETFMGEAKQVVPNTLPILVDQETEEPKQQKEEDDLFEDARDFQSPRSTSLLQQQPHQQYVPPIQLHNSVPSISTPSSATAAFRQRNGRNFSIDYDYDEQFSNLIQQFSRVNLMLDPNLSSTTTPIDTNHLNLQNKFTPLSMRIPTISGIPSPMLEKSHSRSSSGRSVTSEKSSHSRTNSNPYQQMPLITGDPAARVIHAISPETVAERLEQNNKLMRQTSTENESSVSSSSNYSSAQSSVSDGSQNEKIFNMNTLQKDNILFCDEDGKSGPTKRADAVGNSAPLLKNSNSTSQSQEQPVFFGYEALKRRLSSTKH